MDKKNIILPLVGVDSAHCALRVGNALGALHGLPGHQVDQAARVAILPGNTPAQMVRDAVGAIRAHGYDVAMDRLHFTATGISCSGCAEKATGLLLELPGIIGLRVDHVSKAAEVEVVRGVLALDDLLAALRPAGYGPVPKAA